METVARQYSKETVGKLEVEDVSEFQDQSKVARARHAVTQCLIGLHRELVVACAINCYYSVCNLRRPKSGNRDAN